MGRRERRDTFVLPKIFQKAVGATEVASRIAERGCC